MDIAGVFAFHGQPFEARCLKFCWSEVISTWLSLNIEPHREAWSSEHATTRFHPFKPSRHELEASELRSVELVRMRQGSSSEITNWSHFATIKRDRGICAFGWVLDSTQTKLPTLFDSLAKGIAGEALPRQGAYFSQEMRYCPWFRATGGLNWGPAYPINDDLTMNNSWWQYTREEGRDEACVLRDLYLRNFLSKPYFDAPFGKTGQSLEEWIREDPARRGSLTPFTEQLTEWAPPVERIPALREELYRAGRLFYWRFFDPSEALHRPPESFHEPWEAPEPIPEIYRESFYADKDPGLVY